MQLGHAKDTHAIPDRTGIATRITGAATVAGDKHHAGSLPSERAAPFLALSSYRCAHFEVNLFEHKFSYKFRIELKQTAR